MSKLQKIGIESYPSEHYKTFHFAVETARHVELGKLLHRIEGIQNSGPDSYPEGMNRIKVYKLTLQKDPLFLWKDLLPVICKIMENYFKKKIEFQNVENENPKSPYIIPGLISFPLPQLKSN